MAIAAGFHPSPVPYFQPPVTRRALGRRPPAGQGDYRLALVSSGTYLDLAVDGSSQIYVLDTHSPSVNVPHLAIDYWRSIYAANYDPLIDIATGKPHINPALGVAQPSLSRFDPQELIGNGRHRQTPTPKPKYQPKHTD